MSERIAGKLHAELAEDLRKEVREMIKKGLDDEQNHRIIWWRAMAILSYMIHR